MARHIKNPPMGLMASTPKRRYRRMSESKVQKAGKVVTAAFVMDVADEVTAAKANVRRKRLHVDSGITVETHTATAINSIQVAIGEVAGAASLVLPEAAKYPNLSTLESDDTWHGNPRDMPDEDLAFFGLEK